MAEEPQNPPDDPGPPPATDPPIQDALPADPPLLPPDYELELGFRGGELPGIRFKTVEDGGDQPLVESKTLESDNGSSD